MTLAPQGTFPSWSSFLKSHSTFPPLSPCQSTGLTHSPVVTARSPSAPRGCMGSAESLFWLVICSLLSSALITGHSCCWRPQSDGWGMERCSASPTVAPRMFTCEFVLCRCCCLQQTRLLFSERLAQQRGESLWPQEPSNMGDYCMQMTVINGLVNGLH